MTTKLTLNHTITQHLLTPLWKTYKQQVHIYKGIFKGIYVSFPQITLLNVENCVITVDYLVSLLYPSNILFPQHLSKESDTLSVHIVTTLY